MKLSRRESVGGILRLQSEPLSNLDLSKGGSFSPHNQHLIGGAGSTSSAETKDRVRNNPWFGACCSRRILPRLGNTLPCDYCGLLPESPGKVRILRRLH